MMNLVRQSSLRRKALLLGLLVLLAFPGGRGQADELPGQLAVAPFAVHTQGLAHTPELNALLEDVLTGMGIPHNSAEDLRPVLRLHRIRSRGAIGRQGARLIAEATGARYLLLGSWDVYSREEFAEVALSLRLLDLSTLQLVAAVSAGSTGEDHLGIFEKGRIEDRKSLLEGLLKTTLNQLLIAKSQENQGVLAAGFENLAVIPLNNYSETNYAERVLANVVLSELLSAGYFVVEPGFVRELELEREEANRGGIGRDSAATLRRELGVGKIVTGALDIWQRGRGPASGAVPRVACGLRLVDAGSGHVEMAREYTGAGNENDGLFWHGRQRSVVNLAGRLARTFVHDLNQHLKEDHIDD